MITEEENKWIVKVTSIIQSNFSTYGCQLKNYIFQNYLEMISQSLFLETPKYDSDSDSACEYVIK